MIMTMAAAAPAPSSSLLRFDDGAVQFRQRLVLSVLSCRPVLIKNIRNQNAGGASSSASSSSSIGLRRHEISFLRLLSSLTNGTRVEINSTGTQLRFHPGMLVGGEVAHDCPQPGRGGDDEGGEEEASHYRPVGWFLEGVLPLAPFGKEPLSLTLTGITDGACSLDPSADYLRAAALPLLRAFGIGADAGGGGLLDDALLAGPQAPSLRVLRRGGAPAGGGAVRFYCPVVPKELSPIDLVDAGKVKRVRGTAVSTRVVSGSSAARAAYGAKGLLQRLLPDVWIHTDAHSQKRHMCGPSPSLGLVLAAESTTGAVHAAECCLDYGSGDNSDGAHEPRRRELPEDLGRRGAAMLLEEVRRGGCVDTGMQPLALVWMCLTPEDVSRIRVGTLSEHAVATLRLLKLALGVEFKVRADPETRTVVLSCLGIGYRNMARAST